MLLYSGTSMPLKSINTLTLQNVHRWEKDLVNFTAIAKRNIMECLPKILTEEPYKIRVVFSTLAEQRESEKIENSTIAEFKRKILDKYWTVFLIRTCGSNYLKKEVSGKYKQAL